MNASTAVRAESSSSPVADELSSVLHWAASVPQVCVTQTDPIVARTIETPLGSMIAAASRDGLCLLEFGDRPALEREVKDLARLLSRPVIGDIGDRDEVGETGEVSEPLVTNLGPARFPGVEHLNTVERELRAYFDGTLKDFSVTLNLPGSAFERRVWAALAQIPFGETTSYGRLAFKLGMPGAARAVGRANGRNRVAIVVPCHRVVNEDGSLCGYGGGIDRKQRLLELERAAVTQPVLFG